MKRLSNWIEIPITDMGRATKFYSEVLGPFDFHQMDMGGLKYAMFPAEDQTNGGALVFGDHYVPSAEGVLIYLDGGSDLSIILNKVASAGGSVIMQKTYLGEMAGYVGSFLDSEGNRLGLQHM